MQSFEPASSNAHETLPPPIADIPRLPPPTEVPQTRSVPTATDPITLQQTVAEQHRPKKQGGALSASLVVICLLAVAAGIVVVGLQTRSNETSDTADASELSPSRDLVDSEPSDIVLPTVAPTTIPAITAVPVATVADLSEQIALQNRCRDEHAIVFTSFQAFYLQTGAVPSHPDALVNSGWLEAHPDGWSSRWQIIYDDGAYYVTPQPGSLCDG